MKRHVYSNDFKLQVVKEALETGNKALVARRYELSKNLIYRWTKEYEQGHFGQTSVDQVDYVNPQKMEQENTELKKLLGEKDIEIAVLRHLIKKKNPHLLKK
ncbi:transposase [Alteribacillus bidgolensis]|uniref:Transposase and inactivated derivatives n=1 Tax=Alteribacillus bidgolensis TaxID=930129 RepID=A0A1G8JIP6_9BACI|nr:transposase [Alteribacillus bidgolensis]SDI31159.1 Transposase and inactivated derivatives [Alteribacillus bidgolensis]